MRLFAKLAVCFVLSVASVHAHTDDLAAQSRRGKELMAAGRFEEAIPVYRDLVRALPNDPGPIMDLGLALHMAGLDREAVTQFQAVLKLKPTHWPARLFLGAAYLRLKEPARAVEPLRGVVRVQPDHKEARLMLGEALFSLERFEPAVQQFERLCKLDPASPKAWNGLGQSYEGLAGQNFEKLEKAAVGSAYWLVLVAEARAKADQYNRAFFFYREALAQMPTMRGVHRAIAEIYRKAGHADWAAIEEERERQTPAIDCNQPSSSGADRVVSQSMARVRPEREHEAMARKLECAFQAGQYGEVVTSSKGADSVEAIFWRTRAYNELARQAFSRLAQLPPSAEVHELLAKIHFGQKDYSGSAKEWEEALKLSPENLYYQQGLAIARSAGGDYDGAQQMMKDLIKQSPNSVELNYWLGFTLLGLEKPQDAIPFLEKAVEGDPNVLLSRRDLARAYLRVGQVEKAIPHLKAALPMDDDGSLYYQLAQAYRRTGQNEQERQMLHEFRAIQSSVKVERKKLEEQMQISPP